jgi:outer membrane protein assembly factor BamD (BamD/ComL family)
LRLANELPKAALSQEREVLMIEALMAQGETASAQRRVRAFIAAHPNSPHSAQLTRFLGQK